MGTTTEDSERAAEARESKTRPDHAKLLTTLCFPKRPAWGRRLETIDVDGSSPASAAIRIVRAARGYDAIVVNGDGAPRGQVAAVAILKRRRRPPISV